MKSAIFFSLLVALLPALALAQTFNFDNDETGKPPKFFSTALTGKVGLWTKADSYTLFDDLSIQVIK